MSKLKERTTFAAAGLILGLAAAGCNTDHDTIPDKVQAAAVEEAEEALEVGAEALGLAVREALDAAGGGALASYAVTGTADVTGTISIGPDVVPAIEATLTLERAEEAPIEIAVATSAVDRNGGPFSGGLVTFTTEGHVALGGGRGGHAHGGGAEQSEEEEATQPLEIEVVPPATTGVLTYFGGASVEIELEGALKVPAP